MTPVRTATQLQDLLDSDFAWRIQEISSMKSAIGKTPSGRNRMLLRAGIMLLYAHWEGLVKNSSQWYLEYVSSQRLNYDQLLPCFIVFGLKKHLNELDESERHLRNVRTVEFLLSELGGRANLRWKGAIDTESNLSSKVFHNIASSIGVDPSPYEIEFNFIDTSLLARRNSIAHGEHVDIAETGYRELSDRVANLLRRYKTDIENSMIQSSYLVKVAT